MPRAKTTTTAIFCNKYKPNKEGLCTVSIRVHHFTDVRRYYDTGYKMTPEAFEGLFASRVRPEQKNILMALNAEEQRAKDCIDELKTGFTFERFERLYLSNLAISDSLYAAFTDYVFETFDPKEQYSTITSYETARNSFKKFRPSAVIGDVTVKFLKAYETWLLDNEGSITTVGIYCRSLRAVINWVIRKGMLSKELYPFGRSNEQKYEIPTGKNPKKALLKTDIYQLLTHNCKPGSMQQMARDYWAFLYLGNGMNMKDMLLLTWSVWTKEGISFIREKTKRTKREAKIIKVVVQPIMVEIIQRWGNSNKAKDQYIFPHLEPGMTAKEIREKVQLVTKLINKYVDQVCEDAGITKKVRTGEARDSFATVMKNSGASGALISELMGHGSEKTTAHYFGRFENDQQEVAVTALTSFLNEKAANK